MSDKSWSYNIGVAAADVSTQTTVSQSVLWFIYTNMLSNLWTMVSSNNWTTRTGLTWGLTNTQARSWVLLRSPEGLVAGPNGSYLGDQSRLYLCLECLGSTINYNMTIYTAITSAGTATAIPGGGISLDFAQGKNFSGWPTFAQNLSFCSMPGGGFFVTVGVPMKNRITTLIGVLPLAGVAKTGAIGSKVDLPYGLVMISLYDSSDGLQPIFFDYYYNSVNQGVRAINKDGITAAIPRLTYLQQYWYSPTYIIGQDQGSGGNRDGENETFKLHYSNNHPADRGYMGHLPDISGSVTDMGNGSMRPALSPHTHCNAFKIQLPANAPLS